MLSTPSKLFKFSTVFNEIIVKRAVKKLIMYLASVVKNTFQIGSSNRQDELNDLSKAYHLKIKVIILDIRYNSHCITIIKLVFFLPV